MSAADLLLVLVNTTPGAEATVPGKLFEYLAVARPILAVLPRGAEAADIVKRTRSGWSAQAGDVDSILSRLRMAYHAFRMRQPPTPDEAEVARYDRREQAKVLAALLTEIAR